MVGELEPFIPEGLVELMSLGNREKESTFCYNLQIQDGGKRQLACGEEEAEDPSQGTLGCKWDDPPTGPYSLSTGRDWGRSGKGWRQMWKLVLEQRREGVAPGTREVTLPLKLSCGEGSS